jgi:hypothetical protein
MRIKQNIPEINMITDCPWDGILSDNTEMPSSDYRINIALEAALSRINLLLMRLNELAEQSQKGTYREGINRAGLQQEADSILAEIDRIAQPVSSVSIKK